MQLIAKLKVDCDLHKEDIISSYCSGIKIEYQNDMTIARDRRLIDGKHLLGAFRECNQLTKLKVEYNKARLEILCTIRINNQYLNEMMIFKDRRCIYEEVFVKCT